MGPGVIIISSFTYRGAPEEFSNSYHFQGSAPANPTDWRALVDKLVTFLKTANLTSVSIVRALCYEDMAHDSVYTYDLTHFSGAVPGVVGPPAYEAPGDAAYWLRWSTNRVTSHGKAIYLRKYYHGVSIQAPPAQDAMHTNQSVPAAALAGTLLTPSAPWPGLADLDGSALPGGHLLSPFVTTRTLKRRGRRPT